MQLKNGNLLSTYTAVLYSYTSSLHYMCLLLPPHMEQFNWNPFLSVLLPWKFQEFPSLVFHSLSTSYNHPASWFFLFSLIRPLSFIWRRYTDILTIITSSLPRSLPAPYHPLYILPLLTEEEEDREHMQCFPFIRSETHSQFHCSLSLHKVNTRYAESEWSLWMSEVISVWCKCTDAGLDKYIQIMDNVVGY